MITAPSSLESSLGKRPAALLALTFTVYAIWRWSTQAEHHEAFSWIYPVLGVATCWQCGRARKKVEAFRAYRAEWDAMAGDAPLGDAPQREAREGSGRAGAGASGRIGRTLTLWLLWAFGGAWCAVVPASDPKTPYAAMLFLGLTAWGAFAVVRALGRRVLRRARSDSSAAARRSQAREHVVSICLPKPRSSPSLAHITRALPPYCRALLQRSRVAQSDPQEAPSPMH